MTDPFDFAGRISPLTRRAAGGSLLVAALATSAPVRAEPAMAPQVLDHGNFIDLKQFGAIGDGEHDDTDRIKAAVAHCSATGRTLYVPAGTYLVTSSIVVDTAVGFTIFGDGYASCIRPGPGGTYIPLLVQRTGFAAILGMHLKNFRIDANGTGQLDTGIITFNNVIGGSITGMWLENGTRRQGASGQNGISCSAGHQGGTGSEVIISQNVIRKFSKAGINYTSESTGAVITSNYIREIGGNGTAPGIQINGGGGAIVSHNHITETEGSGIYVSTDSLGNQSYSANISHNILHQCGKNSKEQGDGILVTSVRPSNGHIVIQGNQAYENGIPRNGGSGIRIINCDNAIISGNSMHRNSFDGIRVESCNYVHIVGNRCSDNNMAGVLYAGGIQLRGSCQHNAIVGNHLSGQRGSQSYAVISDSAAELPFLTLNNNHSTGNARGTLLWNGRGSPWDIDTEIEQATSDEMPAEILSFRMDDSVIYRMAVTVVGKQEATGHRARYSREAMFQIQDGNLTHRDMSKPGEDLNVNSGWGGLKLSAAGSRVSVTVSGARQAKVDWLGRAIISAL